MLKFLNQPYPFSFQSSRRIKQILPIGLCVFTFLIAFKPFGLSTDPHYIQSSAFYTCSGAIIGFFTTVFIPNILPHYFDESRWTLKRNLIWTVGDFFSFATGMFIAFNIYAIYRYNNYHNYTFKIYLSWVYMNLIFGLPLGIIINLFNQYYLLKKHIAIAKNINKSLELNSHRSSKILLEYEVDKYKNIQIEVEHIIYVEALDNYVNIVYEQNGIKKITVRETISNIEQKTNLTEIIYKPHRSYLVNLQYISKVAGDAQGLKVYLKNVDIAIPVSRNKIKEFRSLNMSR